MAYGSEVNEIMVMESDAEGNWNPDRRVVYYPNGTAGEVTWPAGRWPGRAGGYVLVAVRPGCTEYFKGLAGVTYVLVPVPRADCPIGPPRLDRYFLQVEVSTDPAAPYVLEKEIPLAGVIDAQLSLGTIFSPRIVKKRTTSGGPATVIPVISLYSRTPGTVIPALETNTNLWRTTNAVSLNGEDSSGSTLKYSLAHLGRADFILLPISESAPPLRLQLSIVAPPALGGSQNQWDERIIEAAHERGIPPQILKGQIRQESPEFKEGEFRYEPCSSDFAEISRGSKLIEKPPYSIYAMDAVLDDDGLADTVDLRNSLYILDRVTGERRHLKHDDTAVTAKEIWTASDVWPRDDEKGRGQKWSRQTCGALNRFLKADAQRTIDDFIDALDFTAQTPVASSYGVMQAMYSTAIGYEWSVPDPENSTQTSQSPRYLRDSAEALAVKRGGSIFVGGTEDVARYIREYGSRQKTPASFASQEDFYDSFKEPLRKYTGGGSSQAEYGVNIVDTYQFDYLPTQPAQVFK